MITPKERLHRILTGEKVDRPAGICPGGMMNMVTEELMQEIGVFLPAAHTDARMMAELAKAVYERDCFENCGVPFCMTIEAEAMGAEVEMGSSIVEPHVSVYAIDKLEEYTTLKEIDITQGREKVVLDAIGILKEEVKDAPIVGNLTGPISTATSVIEPTEFYKALRKKKELAHAYMEFVTKQLIVLGKAMIERGADVIAISDPSGTGEILGPKYFEEFSVKYLNQLIEGLRTEGVGIIVHICGHMGNVYPQMNQVQADALSFDSVVPMKEARENLPGRVLMGNVSTYTLEFGQPEKVKMLVKSCLENGSQIIAPACGLGMKSPLENVRAILKELKEEKRNLLDVLLEQGVFVDNPCNGKGICGKCKVKVLSGNISPMTLAERKWLKEEEIEAGIRLSCMTEVYGEVEVEALQQERKHKVLTKGFVPEFDKEFREGLGIIVDIGTTTVVLALVDLTNGEELANASMINAQKQFGLDVLTRISYEFEHPETGADELQKVIVDSLNQMIGEVCEKSGRNKQEIKEIHVAANCTMMHMLLGVDARSIGVSPYKPVFLEAKELKAEEVGIFCEKNTTLYCLPHVSAYIGADIVAGVNVCDLQKKDGNVLFIDIGTNGELVLLSNGKMLSCSCAAGPALEGMNISAGMRAAVGAIEDVKITSDGVELKVIGDSKAEGLCGSGILAVVKEMLQAGIIKKTGAFARTYGKTFVLQEEPEIAVTQQDVRQVQLAKGAILSGIVALLTKAGITLEELDEVLIAGQFGAHLPADSLIGIGILPKCVENKLVYVGNSSKTGAYKTLMSLKAKEEMEQLAREIEYMELAESENYEQLFIKIMTFGEV